MKDAPARKLAVILHADVVGSTALVKADAALAHERIRDAFRRFSGTISRYGGVPHEIWGDALVAEFARASDAVSAALAFQAANYTHNAELPDDIRPVIRVGVAMGEIVVGEGALTGEGTVLAQRLEQLADKGGVCIQGAVYEAMPKHLPFDCENLGECRVKGFDDPVKVYSVSLSPGATVPEYEAPTGPDPAELSGKPSIVVLPFTNISGDPEQEYFADGITEDLTTALSQFEWSFVIARNSAFTYKGMAVDVEQVGKDLGIRYVLQGSLRCAGDRVRINVQLVDAQTDRHVWANRYERAMDNVFELQDEIVSSIAATVGPELTSAEIERVRSRRPNTRDAWDYYLRALAAYHRITRDEMVDAIGFLEKAIDTEPEFANGYALLARCYVQMGARGWVRPAREAFQQSRHFANTAVQLAPSSPEANHSLAFVLNFTGEARQAVTVARRAVDLNPNFAEAHVELAHAYLHCGELHEALAACRRAERSNPRDSRRSWVEYVRAQVYFMLGEYHKAIELSRTAVYCDPADFGSLVVLACAHAQLGCEDEARYWVDELLRLIPRYNLRAVSKNPMFVQPELVDKLVESLRLAGLPEE